MAFPSSADLVAQAETLLASVKSYDGDHAAKVSLLHGLDSLRRAIVNPIDVLFGKVSDNMVTASLNTMIQLGVIDSIPPLGSGSITAEEIALKIGKDSSIISSCFITDSRSPF